MYVAFLQEPTPLKQCGRIPKILQTFVVNNTDSVAIKQVSDKEATFIEIRYKSLNVYGSSL